jgi:hypothetical protein
MQTEGIETEGVVVGMQTEGIETEGCGNDT